MPIGAFAQGIIKFSTSEDVVIAFYKTGKTVPNFKRWARESYDHRHAAVTRKPRIFEREMTRLQNKYNSYNTKSSLLTLRTYVRLDTETMLNAQGQEEYKMNIEFTRAKEALYFPYDFMGERIAVMPHKLDLLLKPDLSETQYKMIEGSTSKSRENIMIVRLQPRQSDLSRPHMIDGMEQWLFITDIISMEIWTTSGSFLWEYNKPGYTSPETKKLQGLYGR